MTFEIQSTSMRILLAFLSQADIRDNLWFFQTNNPNPNDITPQWTLSFTVINLNEDRVLAAFSDTVIDALAWVGGTPPVALLDDDGIISEYTPKT